MTPEQLWQAYLQLNPSASSAEPEAFAFGMTAAQANELANLVQQGIKVATASAHPLYLLEEEPLPQADTYAIVLDGQGEAVCVIVTTKVYVVPFNQVTAEHAAKEGEGDLSLGFWQKVHRDFFTEELAQAGLTFSEEMLVVCEEFEVVYHAKK